MTASEPERLYILSFDHRGSFKKGLMGIAGEPTQEERRRISELKALDLRRIRTGNRRRRPTALLRGAHRRGVRRRHRPLSPERRRPLGDARRALGSGRVRLRVRRGVRRAHRGVRPRVREGARALNPDGDTELNRRQAKRLSRLSGWLHAHDRKFLFELLVPATAAQLNQVAGDDDAYDRDLRPALVVRTLASSKTPASSRTSGRSRDSKRLKNASTSSIRRKPAGERTCGAWCSAAERTSPASRTG